VKELEITVEKRSTRFRPGDEIAGEVSWQLGEPPESVELRLFWHTEGNGSEDVGVVEVLPFKAPLQTDRRPFRVRLPDGPFSFSGRLITLRWALELLALPLNRAAYLGITLAPNGTEVRLDAGG
jgi:hypothetical protein